MDEQTEEQKPKILVVDDTEDNLDLLAFAMKRKPVNMLRASSGKECLVIARREIPDIILLDIQMPEMDGYDAMKFIKNINPKIPVIAQTAFALIDEQQRCIDFGFDDYVSKPIIFEELFKKMSRFL